MLNSQLCLKGDGLKIFKTLKTSVFLPTNKTITSGLEEMILFMTLERKTTANAPENSIGYDQESLNTQ